MNNKAFIIITIIILLLVIAPIITVIVWDGDTTNETSSNGKADNEIVNINGKQYINK